MRIIVDADACPSLHLIEDVATKYNTELILYTDVNHNIKSDVGKVIVVDQGYQNVDIYISNIVSNNDIVITADYGLALICLSKDALVIHPKGTIYNNNNIDIMMFERYLSSQIRKQTKKNKGPKKRTSDDDNLLVKNLAKMLSEK